MKLRALLLSLVIGCGSFSALDAKPKNKVKTPKPQHPVSYRAPKARKAPKLKATKYKSPKRAAKTRMRRQKKVRTV
jgi:hypothetical protein